MIRHDASRVIGTITLGRQCFAIRAYPEGLATLAQYLTTYDRLILTAPGHDPLVVLRLGDLLRDRSLRGRQLKEAESLLLVPESVDPSKPSTEAAAYTAKRQGRPSSATEGDQ